MSNFVKHRIEFKAKRYAKYIPKALNVLRYLQTINGSIKLLDGTNLKLIENE